MLKKFEEKKKCIIDRIRCGEEYCYDIKEGMTQEDIDRLFIHVSV